jgi:uncharacterized protein YyaL (SSP411 family)
MDFWSSTPGVLTRRLFYKSKFLGAPFAGFALLQETFFPSLLKLYGQPQREAIADAHYAVGFLNLYKLHEEEQFLNRAEEFLDALKSSRCEDYKNCCWGYAFGWENPAGYWPPKTPVISVTPYCFWAFKKHYEITGCKESLTICESAAEFAVEDLNNTEMPDGTISTSYSPKDRTAIINANTYRAAMLLDAYALFKNETYKKEALSNIEFVLSCQNKDGSWYYDGKGDAETFIDNFHTCFVLRNLFICYSHLEDPALLSAIKKGYKFYRNDLFREDGTPIHFAEAKYLKFRKYEMYDYAEGIKLGVLLKDEIDGSLEFSKQLAQTLMTKFQLPDGHFLTRVTTFGQKHKVPYHRWPQAQLFEALTALLLNTKTNL